MERTMTLAWIMIAWFVISLPMVKWAEEDEDRPFVARHPQN